MVLLGIVPAIGMLVFGTLLWSAASATIAEQRREMASVEMNAWLLETSSRLASADVLAKAASSDLFGTGVDELAESTRAEVLNYLDASLVDLDRLLAASAAGENAGDGALRASEVTQAMTTAARIDLKVVRNVLASHDMGEPVSDEWNRRFEATTLSLRDWWLTSDGSIDSWSYEALVAERVTRAFGDYDISWSARRAYLVSAMTGEEVGQLPPSMSTARTAAFEVIQRELPIVLTESPWQSDPARQLAFAPLVTSDQQQASTWLVGAESVSSEVRRQSRNVVEKSLELRSSEIERQEARQRLVGIAAAVVTVFGLCLIVVAVAEVRGRRKVEEQHADVVDVLEDRTRRDPMTGLLNRWQLDGVITTHLEHFASDDAVGVPVLGYLDLDRFKALNDVWGHDVGDQLLTVVSRRLVALIDETTQVVRFGGDEFVIVTRLGSAKIADASEFGTRLVDLVSKPVSINGRSFAVGATAGVSIMGHDSTPESLLFEADAALILAKRNQRGTAAVYNRQVTRSTELVRELPAALEAGEISCHFQPLFDIKTCAFSHVEALARWTRPNGDMVSPGEFIPLVESFGLASELTAAVVSSVTTLQRHPSYPANARVWMNVSPIELEMSDFAKRLLDLCVRKGADPTRLGVEITETAAIGDPLLLGKHLDMLRDHGVLVAIDDFGAGYSPLGLLFDLPIDVVKLDRSLISFIDQQTPTAPIVRGVIDALNKAGMRVVAEGVERQEELSWLEAANADYVQGYLTGRPMSFDALITELDERSWPLSVS